MRSALLFFAVFAAARSLPALSFLVSSCSRRSLKVSVSHERLRTAIRGIKSQHTSGIDVENLVDTLMFKVPRASLQYNSRWCTCLPALDEGMNGEESTAVPSEGSSASSSETYNAALVEAAGAVTEPGGEGNGVGGIAVDLAKGIAFETPKPKDLTMGEDDEEGSEAKKVTVPSLLLYTHELDTSCDRQVRMCLCTPNFDKAIRLQNRRRLACCNNHRGVF